MPGHEGIDIQAPEGSNVYAALPGRVVLIREDGNSDPTRYPYGNQVRIETDDLTSVYAHLSRIDVAIGQTVEQGERIGLAGNTGNSSGAHLHYSLKKAGATARHETTYPYDIINPTSLLSQAWNAV